MIHRFKPFTDGFFETGSQVQEWVMAEARAHVASDRSRRRAIDGPESFEVYRRERRRLFFQSLGGVPDLALNREARETGVLERKRYRIRKLILQSLPSVYVSALLYEPTHVQGKAPGVLMACGHAALGKAEPKYQRVCIDLVRSGFVVLIFDSPSQGEMVQCLDPESGEPVAGINTREHSFLQVAATVAGENIARYFIANARAALDVLCDQPSVDATRIGMTGNSGGGTLTQYMMMADPRLGAAFPGCSLSSRETYLATGSRSYDGEQNLFRAIPDGVDYADFLACFAPRPLRIGAAEYDYFCIEGVLDSLAEAKGVYQSLGAGAMIDLCIAQGQTHGYTRPLRHGCVDWFVKHLDGNAVSLPDQDYEVEPPEALQCTEAGQVLLELPESRPMLDLIRESAQAKRIGAQDLTREELRQRLNLPENPEPLRIRRTFQADQKWGAVERIFFFSEPGILITAVLYLPSQPPARAVLLLIPAGTEGQEKYAGRIHELLESGALVMVLDVRGTGAVRMHQRNSGQGLEFKSTEFRVANDHFLLGTSLASKRTFDVLRGLEYLRQRSDISPTTPMELEAHGWPGIYAVLAAPIDGEIGDCRLYDGLDTWDHAFELRRPDSGCLREPTLLPELKGQYDLGTLVKLAGARHC